VSHLHRNTGELVTYLLETDVGDLELHHLLYIASDIQKPVWSTNCVGIIKGEIVTSIVHPSQLGKVKEFKNHCHLNIPQPVKSNSQRTLSLVITSPFFGRLKSLHSIILPYPIIIFCVPSFDQEFQKVRLFNKNFNV
jgi:hypothetical protein